MLLVKEVVKSYNVKFKVLTDMLIGEQIVIIYYKNGKIRKICWTFSI